MRAVIYCRVSTEEQAVQGISLEAQESRLRAYCATNGLEMVEMIMEPGISASRPLSKRPGGVQLLDLVRKKEVGHVVVLKLDRAFRSALDALEHATSWDKQGIALHLVDQGGDSISTSSAVGRFFFTMLAAVAEMERNLIGERTSTALQHKKAKRSIYCNNVFGFDRNSSSLLPVGDELLEVEKMKRARDRGATLRQIAEDLNRRGVPTKRGGKWFASTVRYVLRNELYSESV